MTWPSGLPHAGGGAEIVMRRTRHLVRIRVGWVGLIGVTICSIYILGAVLGPMTLGGAANRIGAGPSFVNPSAHYWLGTDELGRSEVARIVVASRIAVVAAFESVGIALALGTVLGVAAGYVGGVVDEVLSRLFDLIFSFPVYLLGILVVVVLGPGLNHASWAIGLAFAPQFGRIARSSTREVRTRAYVEAARLSGRKGTWIVMVHVLPNIAGPLSVMVGLTLSNAEGAYAVLSYLGFGVAPPTADYGSMLAAGQGYLTTDPWLVLLPSAALVLLIVGFVFVGDFLRESFDPYGKVGARGVGAGN